MSLVRSIQHQSLKFQFRSISDVTILSHPRSPSFSSYPLLEVACQLSRSNFEASLSTRCHHLELNYSRVKRCAAPTYSAISMSAFTFKMQTIGGLLELKDLRIWKFGFSGLLRRSCPAESWSLLRQLLSGVRYCRSVMSTP